MDDAPRVLPQRFEHGSDGRRDRHRAARGPVHVDVHEPPDGARFVVLPAEQRNAIHHAARAEPFDLKARGERVGESGLLQKPAARLGHNPDGGQIPDRGAALGNQESVHRRVEIRVVGHVVDMAVAVLVHPAGLDGTQ